GLRPHPVRRHAPAPRHRRARARAMSTASAVVAEERAASASGALAAAVAALVRGELVAFPTETVWGLGADARSPAAMERLRRWKGRDAQQRVAVLVPDRAALAAVGIALPPAAARLADAFWPG